MRRLESVTKSIIFTFLLLLSSRFSSNFAQQRNAVCGIIETVAGQYAYSVHPNNTKHSNAVKTIKARK